MARPLRVQATQRYQVDPRNTHDYTTPAITTPASPIDPYERPVVGTRLMTLADALSSVNSSIHALAQERVRQYQKDYEKGLLRAGAGLPLESRVKGMVDAYETFQGQTAASRDYRAKVNEFFLQQAEYLDPEEFEEGLRAISQEFVAGASDKFLEGFVPVALAIEDQAFQRYQTLQGQRFVENNINMLHQIAADQVRGALADAIGDIFDVSDPSALAGDAGMYLVFEERDGNLLFGDQLRKALSETQKAAEKVGLSRSQVSEIYLDAVGTLAIDLGLPELLDFAFIKDESGIALADSVLGDKVRQYKEKAEVVRDIYRKAEDERIAKEKADAQRRFINNMWRDISELHLIEDPKAKAELAKTLFLMMDTDEAKSLPESTYRMIVEELSKVRAGEYQMPATSDQWRVAELYELALFNELTYEDILDAKNSFDLNFSDYKMLVEEYRKQEERKAAEAAEWRDKNIIKEHMELLTRHLTGVNEFGIAKDATLEASFKIQLTTATQQWINDNGRYPSWAEWMVQVADPLLSEFNTSIEMITRNFGTMESPEFLNLRPPQEDTLNLNWIQRTIRNLGNRWLGWAGYDAPTEEMRSLWRWDEGDAFRELSYRFDGGEPKTYNQVVFELSQEGDTPDAIDWYMRHFVAGVAMAWASTDNYKNYPAGAFDLVRARLRQRGFPEKIIEDGINGAKWMLQGGDTYFKRDGDEM